VTDAAAAEDGNVLDMGLILVVFRPADWPWAPKPPGVTANHDRLLVVGTKRRGPKQPIKPLPEDLRDDGPPLYADTPRFVLHEGLFRNAAPYLVPLEALEQKREALFGGNYAGAVDEIGSSRDGEYRLSRHIDKIFFKGEQRFHDLFRVCDRIPRWS
jgi:hypothetical protein